MCLDGCVNYHFYLSSVFQFDFSQFAVVTGFFWHIIVVLCRVPGELIPDLSSIVFGEKQVSLSIKLSLLLTVFCCCSVIIKILKT